MSLVAIAASIALIATLRIVVDEPGAGVAFLFVFPIAAAAVGWGLRAGLYVAAICFALFAAEAVLWEQDLGTLAFITRLVVFFGLAVVAGLLAARMRHTAEESRRLAAIVESSDDAIVGVSLAGRITSWNRAAERLYGHSREEAVGEHASLVTFPDTNDRTGALLERVARGEGVEGYETVHLRKDGSTVEVALTVSPVFGADGEVVGASIIGRDVGERRRAEQRFSQLLELAPDAIIGFDAEGTIRLVNTQAERMYGFTRDELIDQPLAKLVPDRFMKGYRAELERYFRDPRVRPLAPGVELFAKRKDGGEFPCDIALSSMPGEHGLLAVATVRDVTERKQVVDAAERLKSEFFALVSHELRTPLTAVVGYAEMIGELEAARLSDEGADYLEIIRRNARRLDGLVQDLLLVAQVEAGTFTIQLGTVEIAEVARACLDASRPAANESGVRLTPALDDVPRFAGDPGRLGQVIDNLVSNAIKFTPEGGRVDVRVSEHDGRCLIEVADTGAGIEPAEQRHLFDRFYRAHEARRGHISGAGLGLAITKAIVDEHHGDIQVESAPGEGTTFQVTLPMPAVTAERSDDPQPSGVA